MSTIVFVHAHPDDEASQTGGTMARASAEGHRVVCVYATGGDHGTPPADLADRSLAEHRREEAEASAAVLGTARLVWLDYVDSGMLGWDTNHADGSFWSADTGDVARRVAAVLDEEDADVVVGYDWHGGYGHPDHVQVHRAVRGAVELARRRPRHLEVTMNRDQLRRVATAVAAPGLWDVDAPMADGHPMGTPEAELHWAVDVTAQIGRKREALACHASQPDAQGMLAAGDEEFAGLFGWEFYLEPGRPAGMVRGWPF